MPYLHTIGLENFRLFKEKTVFELAPITILTGINNSGKSSLIKALQLMQSSLESTKELNELNFVGGRHNLGTFSQTKNIDSADNSIRLIFDFDLRSIDFQTLLELEYSVTKNEQESGVLTGLRVLVEGETPIISMKFDLLDVKWKVKLDLEYLIGYFSEKFNQQYFSDKRKSEEELQDEESILSNLFPNPNEERANIFESFYSNNHKSTYFPYEEFSSKELIRGFSSLNEDVKNAILERIKGMREIGNSLDMAGVIGTDLKFIEVAEMLLNDLDQWFLLYDKKLNLELSTLGEFIFKDFLKKELITSLSNFNEKFKFVNSLSSIRANSERLYANNSSIVDINSLLINYSKIDFDNTPDIKRFVKRSLEHFKIGEGLEVKRHQGVATEIFILKNGQKVLLADLGFGFTQLVPIIVKIALIAHQCRGLDLPWEDKIENTFLLEEPESNLHPSYQSKLAELIIDAARTFNIQFIIETHSEYMIRNFQYLTATKKIPSNATKIYYFNQPGTEDFEEAPYREIEIMRDGRLSNEFGEGFFDEIPRLLAFLYNSNSN
ncbi:DUF3696 domain-containing protein [Algoriphagus formosus]|uniref:DUF3696 domain-containing protein n=1 Tax=Algoriphagus formosus TaxID=2007308 RepID=UPI000C28AFB4|nr:DUF3696 domain-containing protein [Algoriphagus formosus]